jgi:hypothetical protein
MGCTVLGSNPGRGGAIFSASVQTGPGVPPSLLYSGYRIFPGGKTAGAGFDHPPTFSAEVKERVELYLYSPHGPLCHVLGRNLPLLLRTYCGPHWSIIIDCSCTNQSLETVVRSSMYEGRTQKFPELLK